MFSEEGYKLLGSDFVNIMPMSYKKLKGLTLYSGVSLTHDYALAFCKDDFMLTLNIFKDISNFYQDILLQGLIFDGKYLNMNSLTLNSLFLLLSNVEILFLKIFFLVLNMIFIMYFFLSNLIYLLFSKL